MIPFIKWPSQWVELWCQSWHNVNTQAELRAVWPQWFRLALVWPLQRFSLHYQADWCSKKRNCESLCFNLNSCTQQEINNTPDCGVERNLRPDEEFRFNRSDSFAYGFTKWNYCWTEVKLNNFNETTRTRLYLKKIFYQFTREDPHQCLEEKASLPHRHLTNLFQHFCKLKV